MSRIGSAIIAGALLLCSVRQAAPASAHTHWKLTWSDEFNGADGAPPDSAKWSIVTGGRGFGNHELEQYTDRSENVHQEHGHLVITARREAFTGTDGIAREYTSARLQTKGKFAQKYGRFEARIRIPKGQGMWPAFWLLGSDIDAVGWPACGEIDVMENVGFEPAKVHGTLHGPRYSGDSALTGAYTLSQGAFITPASQGGRGPRAFSDDFHVYAVEWDEHEIRFFVDNHLYETQTTDSIPGNKRWVFDHPFYLLLNLAVGGDWPKNPDETTQFPQQMLVDYVRVYQRR